MTTMESFDQLVNDVRTKLAEVDGQHAAAIVFLGRQGHTIAWSAAIPETATKGILEALAK